MIYEELANEKISIFGVSEPLVPYEKAMEACRELVKERKKALERIRELTVENAKLKERLPHPSSPPEEDPHGQRARRTWHTKGTRKSK